jgi:hypothetical protein
MTGREVIILVPGLFGFSTIGSIAYFDRVTKLLSDATGITDIQPLGTPATGPPLRRVGRQPGAQQRPPPFPGGWGPCR